MMARREIHREYLALATGIIPEDGTITAPIARKEGSTIERMVDFKHGEYACTHYRRLSITDTDPVYSLVALKLDTGRTHQIRVHMNYIGHPLPGDFLYNPGYSIHRQALHSHICVSGIQSQEKKCISQRLCLKICYSDKYI